MKAILDRLIVEIPEEEVTVGGIIVPKTFRSQNAKIREGIVCSIGPNVTIDVKIGDKVIMTNNYGHDIHEKDPDKHYIAIEEEFILAVIQDE